MASFNKFQPFVEQLAEKVHNLGSDQIVEALTNTAPNATDATLSQITEISYTNFSSRNVTTTSSAQTTGTYKLVLAAGTGGLGGSVGPFRYAGIVQRYRRVRSTGWVLRLWFWLLCWTAVNHRL